ncbi:MAG: hypothetical protein QM526_01415 [Alphaproteobacteria bacterium]|nr:hypothetical protein [Alphaproteobacteria bacterium]
MIEQHSNIEKIPYSDTSVLQSFKNIFIDGTLKKIDKTEPVPDECAMEFSSADVSILKELDESKDIFYFFCMAEHAYTYVPWSMETWALYLSKKTPINISADYRCTTYIQSNKNLNNIQEISFFNQPQADIQKHWEWHCGENGYALFRKNSAPEGIAHVPISTEKKTQSVVAFERAKKTFNETVLYILTEPLKQEFTELIKNEKFSKDHLLSFIMKCVPHPYGLMSTILQNLQKEN